MDILVIITTSVLTSGLVSLLLSYYLDHKKYLRAKKFEAVGAFLDALDKLSRAKVKKDSSDFNEVSDNILMLERASWGIKILFKNNNLHSLCDEVVGLHETMMNSLKQGIKTGNHDVDELRESFASVKEKREQFLSLASEEIKSLN